MVDGQSIDLRLVGVGRGDVELHVHSYGPTAVIGIDHDCGEAFGRFNAEELLRLRDWITEHYGETSPHV